MTVKEILQSIIDNNDIEDKEVDYVDTDADGRDMYFSLSLSDDEKWLDKLDAHLNKLGVNRGEIGFR